MGRSIHYYKVLSPQFPCLFLAFYLSFVEVNALTSELWNTFSLHYSTAFRKCTVPDSLHKKDNFPSESSEDINPSLTAAEFSCSGLCVESKPAHVMAHLARPCTASQPSILYCLLQGSWYSPRRLSPLLFTTKRTFGSHCHNHVSAVQCSRNW